MENRQQAATWRFVVRALGHPNYRRFFIGQGISLIGTWMTRLATGWLVFRIMAGDAPLLLGLVGFASQIPTFFLAPLAGTLVDRWNRHRALLVTQVLSLVQSALLAVVAFRGGESSFMVAQLIVLSLFQGVINAFDMPARQALLSQLVERREDLPNAIAMNSFLVNGGRLVGPALAGGLIAVVGEAWCFVIDAISYLAVIATLWLMRLAPLPKSPMNGTLLSGLTEGFKYAFGFAPIRSLILLLALVSFLGMPYSVLLPLFADRLGGGPMVLGFLTAASGIGAVAGAILLASRRSVVGLGRLIIAASLIFGVGLIGFAWSSILWLSLLMMLGVGFGMMVQMAASNTILQTIAEEDKRGRVMSFFSMAVMGMMPFGSLLAGLLAGILGAPMTVALSGAGVVVGGVVFALQLKKLRVLVRPIYVRLGIVPEVAGGLQTAAELTRPPAD